MTGSWKIAIASLVLLAGCSSVSNQVHVVDSRFAAKPPNCEIEIIDKSTSRPHTVVAEIDAYVRRNKLTGDLQGVFEEAVPELKRQGCAAGADAVIVLNQTVSQSGEFKLLYVKAVAIHY